MLRISLVLVIGATAACSPSADSRSSELAAALEARVDEHDSACQAARAPAEIDAETDRYERDVRGWADDAAGCATMMGMPCCCCGRGGDDVADDALGEVEQHRRTVEDAEDVDAAQEECSIHRARMRIIIEDASATASRP